MRLKITTPGRTFEFSPRAGMTAVIVGNRELDDVHIADDPGVSGPHVRLERFGADWSFTDQFSEAGTLHNGEKTYNGSLKAGDVLRVGDSEITVVSLEEAPAAPSAHEPTFDTSIPAPRAEPAERQPAAAPLSMGTLSVHARRLNDRLIGEFESGHGLSLRGNAAALARIRQAAEQAVWALENEKSTEVNLPFLTSDASGPKHLNTNLARKHLHEDWRAPGAAPPPPPVRTPPSSTATPAAKSKARASIGWVIVVGFIVFGGGVLPWLMDDSPDDSDQQIQQAIDEAQDGQSKDAREQQLTKAVQALMEDKETPPQDLLDALDGLEKEARAAGVSVGWDYQRARTYLDSRVYTDVSRHESAAGLRIYNLQEEERFREASRELRELEAYLKASPHNKRVIDALDLDEAVERRRVQIAAGNEKLLAKQLFANGEAMSRDDFPNAADALKPLIADADIEETALKALADELKATQAKAAGQVAGDLPPKRKAYDRRTDKLPDSPSNTLLKAGDPTARTRLSTLYSRTSEAIRKGEWNGRRLQVWGMSARIQGDEGVSWVPLTFTRKVGEAELTFTTRELLPNYAPAVRLAVLEQATEPMVADRMAWLILAFDNGLADDAGRVAAGVRAAAPESTGDLDAILAAKWRVAAPEGGFPERDGRIVPE